MGKILAAAEIDERVTLELKAFSGLRTEELARMWWVLINAKAGYINVTDAVAKVNQRAVPILENLKRRLAAYPEAEKRDKISKRWGSSNSLYHVWKRVTDKAGLPYKKNAFRNSYISYRLAQTKDINLVAYESGNSPEMIRKYLPGLGHARTGGGLVFPLTKVEWSHGPGSSELSIIRQGSITRARPSGRSSPGPEGSKGAPWGHWNGGIHCPRLKS